MKIENSTVLMQAASYKKEELVKQEHLKTWVDTPTKVPQGDVIDISLQGLEAQKTEALKPMEDDLMSSKDKLKLKLIEAMLTKLMGKKFKFRFVSLDLKQDNQRLKSTEAEITNAASATGAANPQAQGNQRLGWGMEYHYSEQYTEVEQMSFEAMGKVSLKDGRQIDFSVALHMSRSYSESFSLDLKAGDALKDPLAIDLTGRGIQLTDKTMHFDLDFDGTKDDIPVLAQGSGYLVIDRNNNKILDDGSELFGPKTDHGFEELAEYDKDSNKWIDENDDIFGSLKIWVSDGNGDGKLIGLVEAGVGAIFLGEVDSPYTFKDGQNNTLGVIKQTGVYLKESGQAGLIHEVDLKL